jgi:hypothetical protein
MIHCYVCLYPVSPSPTPHNFTAICACTLCPPLPQPAITSPIHVLHFSKHPHNTTTNTPTPPPPPPHFHTQQPPPISTCTSWHHGLYTPCRDYIPKGREPHPQLFSHTDPMHISTTTTTTFPPHKYFVESTFPRAGNRINFRVVPTNVHMSIQGEAHRAFVKAGSQQLDALRFELICGRWWVPLGRSADANASSPLRS